METSADLLLQEAGAHYSAGELAKAEAAYQAVLRTAPRHPEANYQLGLLAAKNGQGDLCAKYLKSALEADPAQERYWLSYAQALWVLRRSASAVTVLEQAKQLGLPHHSINELLAQIRLREAPEEGARTHFDRGNALKAQGKLDEAAQSYQRSIALRPDFAEAQNNLGSVFLEQGRRDQAAAAFGQALAINPGYAEAHNNLGVSFHKLGNFDKAALSYQRALALKPDYAEAHSNLGAAHAAQGKRDEAINSYRRAITLRPEFAETFKHLGDALSESGRSAEAYTYYLRAAELTYPASPAAPVSAHKARHDREQRRYRLATAENFLEAQFHLEGGEKLAGPAINPESDVDGIESRWRQSRPQIVVIDDFLTPEALEGLRRFCWGSTIWRESFKDGYLGARPESGFACPLLAQTGEELRLAYPGIFRDHPLLYSWAFKYDNRLGGTGVHADFAAVNVNFWITPDEANLDPESGGLRIWDAAAPADWAFDKYNVGEGAIRDFLAARKAKSVTIPYRANRAVIFNSDLFHETDRMAFQDGYINRRINITFLYGWR